MNAGVKAAAATCLHLSGVLAMLRHLQPADRGLVLMFHRVLPREDMHLCYDPHLVMAEDVFTALLELLARDYRVVSVAELLAGGHPSKKQRVALTFDDAWEDTYSVACPLLKRHNLPATIFLCPQLMSNAENGAMLPEERFARIWDHADVEAQQELVKRGTSAVAGPVRAERKSLSDALKLVSMDARLPLLAELEQEFSTPSPPHRSLMTWNEARSVLRDGFTLGSHTLRHCTLPSENDSIIRQELVESRQEILAQTGVLPDSLAYPNGAVNPRVEGLVREAGYSHAFSTAPGFVDCDSRPFAAPRLPMEDGVVTGAGNKFHKSRTLTYLQLLK